MLVSVPNIQASQLRVSFLWFYSESYRWPDSKVTGSFHSCFSQSLKIITACELSNLPPLLHNRDTHFYLQLDDLSRGLDYLVQRRLEITAQYDLSCSILADNVIRSTVQVTADSHSAGLISTICKQGKYTGRLYHSPHSKYFSFSCLQTELHFQCPVTMNCDTKGW